MKTKLYLLCLLCTLTGLSARAQITELYVTSSTSGNILHGQTILDTPANGFTFSLGPNSSDGYTVQVTDAGAVNPVTYTLEIGDVTGGLLGPGTYNNAVLYGTEQFDVPGLSFFSNSSSDTSLNGYFTIDEVSINPNDISLAVDFFQYDNGQSGAWEEGSLRFNSPIPVPEP